MVEIHNFVECGCGLCRAFSTPRLTPEEIEKREKEYRKTLKESQAAYWKAREDHRTEVRDKILEVLYNEKWMLHEGCYEYTADQIMKEVVRPMMDEWDNQEWD